MTSGGELNNWCLDAVVQSRVQADPWFYSFAPIVKGRFGARIMNVELVLDAGATIEESPTWVAEEDALVWIDRKAPTLHRFDLSTSATRSWALPSDVGGFALSADRSKALVALRSGIFMLDLHEEVARHLEDPPFDDRLHRFNEGACDSRRRF
jgi:sugar lactone lactonase YvrE